MRSFLVEGYQATGGNADLEELARRTDAVAAASESIRYLGSLVLLEEEVCLHVFEAPSVAALVEASMRAQLQHDRVVETVWLEPGSGTSLRSG